MVLGTISKLAQRVFRYASLRVAWPLSKPLAQEAFDLMNWLACTIAKLSMLFGEFSLPRCRRVPPLTSLNRHEAPKVRLPKIP